MKEQKFKTPVDGELKHNIINTMPTEADFRLVELMFSKAIHEST
jgi:hypothetical protein